MNHFFPDNPFGETYSNPEFSVEFRKIFVTHRLLLLILSSKNWIRLYFPLSENPRNGFQNVMLSPETMTILSVKTDRKIVFECDN